MATDDLFFRRTGEEASAFVLVSLVGGEGGTLRARASMEGPAAGGIDRELPDLSGDAPTVLREAQTYAMLNGLDLRIDLNGHEWPATLGILGN